MSTTNSESRIPIVIIKPILYGNTAKHFGSKRDLDGHTHKWTVYVRPFNNDDMSRYINRVQFRLHESYPNNIRVVTKPPYEIEESGWGEFEIQITIYFSDLHEKPVIFYHHLKLFSTDPDVITGKKPLVNEFYDELVFQEPSEHLVRLLKLPTEENQSTEKEYVMKKEETTKRIKTARQRVRHEIDELTERLRITQENIKRIQQRIHSSTSSINENGKYDIVD